MTIRDWLYLGITIASYVIAIPKYNQSLIVIF